jgi:hypothetical protein
MNDAEIQRLITELYRDLGELAGRVKAVEDTFDRELSDYKRVREGVALDIRQIREFIAGAKGGWRVLAVVGAISGLLGSLLGRLVHVIFPPQ